MQQSPLRAFLQKPFGGGGLRARLARGSVWLGAGSGVEQALRLARNMILTRLLVPEALGLMTIVIAVNAALESFTEVGIREAIIQSNEGDSDGYLDAAWWFSLVRAVVLAAIGMALAPWIAGFYAINGQVTLLRCSFLGLLFSGVMSPRVYTAVRHMNYRASVLVTQGGGIGGIVLAVVLVAVMRNVWALVIGFVAEAALRCVLSFLVCPFTPGFRSTAAQRRSLMSYGRGMFGLPILAFIFLQTDIFVVGKMCSKADLGLYGMAASLAKVPTLLITVFLTPLMMPAVAEMKNDAARINRALMQSTSAIVYAGMPLVALIACCGREILAIVYGKAYAVVAVAFALLVASTLLRTASSPCAAVFLAVGQPSLHRRFTALRAALVVTLIYPAVRWLGLGGAAAAVLVSMAVSYVFQVERMRSLTRLDARGYARLFVVGAALALPVVAVWLVGREFTESLQIRLVLGGVGCAVSYAFIGTVLVFGRRGSGTLSFWRPALAGPAKISEVPNP